MKIGATLTLFFGFVILCCLVVIYTPSQKRTYTILSTDINDSFANTPSLESVPYVPSLDLSNYIPDTNFDIIIDHREGTLISMPIPTMPYFAEKSGHCKYEIQILATGSVNKVLLLECTDSIFEDETRKVLLKARYHPLLNKKHENLTFRRSSKVVYKLLDENGSIIPE